MPLNMLRACGLIVALVAAGSICHAAHFEIVAELPVCPGNITLTPDNRIILSLHPFYQADNRVVELKKDGTLIPFPNREWNLGNGTGDKALDSVLGVQCDADGVVWMLDNGLRSGARPKVVAWNTRENRLERIIRLEPPVVPDIAVAPDYAFINDLAVDLRHKAVFISHSAGMNESGIIVVNLATGSARRVLLGHESVLPQNTDLVMNGRVLDFTMPDSGRLKFLIGVNPIALDATDEWLYYGPMSGRSMYRIRSADLLNEALTRETLASRVERYSEKPICDGMSIDKAGNIYISDLEAGAVGVISSERNYRRLLVDRNIMWPESFSFGPDGLLYFTASKLHLTAPLNEGRNSSMPPYHVFRMKPLAEGIVGR
ncbi:MAG: L-dopachrome tautomerase-related protein [Pseudomonadota bacterium]